MEELRLVKIKDLIIESLCDEYTMEESIDQVETCKEISENGGIITIVYSNGAVDKFKSIFFEKLEVIY